MIGIKLLTVYAQRDAESIYGPAEPHRALRRT
jgi:hypothetical protein